MKRIFTLMMLFFAASHFTAVAQTNTCNAEFQYSTSGNTVNFYPVTTTADTIYLHHVWVFGDGSVASELFSPSHTYSKHGTYTVTHYNKRVTPNGLVCSDSFSRVVTIANDLPCNLKAAFSFKRDSIQTNKVYFTNLSYSANDIKSVKWSFGDGTYSDNLNPTHIFQNSGLYNVCLLVRKDSSCAADTCMFVQVQIPPLPDCNFTADYTWEEKPSEPNIILFSKNFASIGLQPIDSVIWNFGDGIQSHDLYIAHAYTAPGSYNVCLTIKKMNIFGEVICAKYTCKTVVVQSNSCTLEADFSWTDTLSTNVHNLIQFTNLSTPFKPTDTIRWNFGDGTPVSYDVNPKHIYTGPGTYNVCIRVKQKQATGTAACVKELCKTIIVKQPCNLQAYFGYIKDSSGVVNTYHFINYTAPEIQNADSVRWSFGDGSTSYDINPTHTFTTPGAYTVCLTVIKRQSATTEPCTSTFCKTIVVEQQPCNFYINFDWKSDSSNSKKINFINLSQSAVNTSTVTWTFGDGTTGSSWNPDHIYNQPGTYKVCLIIATPNNCVKDICKEIVVQAPPSACNLEAGFSWSDSLQYNAIQFTNLSAPFEPTDTIRWNFGDGTPVSYDVNPKHIYTTPGTYNVCIRVKKKQATGAAACVKEFCKTIVVKPTCGLQAYFSFTKDSTTGSANTYHFINYTAPEIHNSDSVIWTFGDGGSSHDINPTHTFTSPGTYTVCLTVKNNLTASPLPCVSTFCKAIVVEPQPCNFYINFDWKTDSTNKKKINFVNLSQATASTAKATWAFGDGITESSWNADHIYSQSGTYKVCLVITSSNNCVKDICKEIVVQAPPPPCNIEPKFTWKLDPANNRKVYFTNNITTTANAILTWSFGDGHSATAWNPDHIYPEPGKYYACLKVQIGNDCIKTVCDSLIIPVLPPTQECQALSLFTFEKSNTDNQRYIFKPIDPNTTIDYTWTFGDSTGSHNMQAEHRYAEAGIYTTCLTAYKNAGCATTTCKEIQVHPFVSPVNPCDTLLVKYGFQRDPANPNKIYFAVTGNATNITEQKWTIFKMPASSSNTPIAVISQNNPAYTFTDTGFYKVCLRAVTANDCVKEYCNEIRIERIPFACELSTYPNPAQSQVTITLHETSPELIHVYVYDLQNQLVKQKDFPGNTGNNTITINIETLPVGVYTVKLMYGNNVCYTKFQKF